MTVHEGKHQFFEAGEFDQTYPDLRHALLTPELRAHADIFVTSFDRIKFLHDLPIQLIAWANHVATCHAIVRTQRRIDIRDASKNNDNEYFTAFQEEFVRHNPSLEDARKFGADNLEGMLEYEDQHFRTGQATPGVQALFAAMIMGAYVALENLAADLWVEAANKRDVLASNWLAKNPKKQFDGTELFGAGFNLSGQMGTILRRTKKVTFDQWTNLKEAYSFAFVGTLDTAFEPSGSIYLAEKTRHLFAHRGGLIDQKFKQETASYPEYQNVVVGERLRLTGPVVKARIEACLQCGANLLKGVDHWILHNR